MPFGLRYNLPFTLDTPETGKVYGFLVENDKWYLAGSFEFFNTMIDNRFRNSTKNKVFVSIKNSLVDVKEIKWVKV
jgi:hypothetical protein